MLKMALLKLILFGCILIQAYGNNLKSRVENPDAVVDKFLNALVQQLKSRHHEEISLPYFRERIEKKIGFFFSISGEFEGKEGWFRDLTTLKRIATSTQEKKSKQIILGINVGLDDLEFGFKKFYFSVLTYNLGGSVKVTVDHNAMHVNLVMDFYDGSDCRTTIDKVEMIKLDGLHLKMSFGTPFDWLVNWIGSIVANKFHAKLDGVISEILAPAMKQVLADSDICKEFINTVHYKPVRY